MKVAWWTPVILGALVAFGAGMGIASFLMVSETAIVMARWLRRTHWAVKWRNRHHV